MRLALVVDPKAGGGGGARIAARVSTVANGLLGSGSSLAVIPAGNGNDFARNLGLPRHDLKALTRVLERGHASVRHVDVGHVATAERERHFLNVAGAGFDSVVTARGEQVRRLGRYRYLYSTVETLARFRLTEFAVTVDGERHETRGYFVAVGNGPAYGAGMRIAPGASLDDGMLEACLIGPLPKRTFLRLIPSVYSGRHVRYPDVHVFRGTAIEIDTQPRHEVYADGERVGETPVRLPIRAGVLPVLVPLSHGT